jgi:MlaA lipoprotein/MBOAT, membrane-bound O-acyltransferase family
LLASRGCVVADPELVVEMELRELLSFYQFPGDDIPIVKGFHAARAGSPLGGNRGSKLRTYANLWAVFLLCGLWHGASRTFVIWGAHHGLFNALSRAISNYVSDISAMAAACPISGGSAGPIDALQGRPRRAGDTTMRFLINSTVGVGGIFDVAKKLGYPNHDTDFALTFANWDVPEGPYLYLPILGPSSSRDAQASRRIWRSIHSPGLARALPPKLLGVGLARG